MLANKKTVVAENIFRKNSFIFYISFRLKLIFLSDLVPSNEVSTRRKTRAESFIFIPGNLIISLLDRIQVLKMPFLVLLQICPVEPDENILSIPD